VAAVQTPPPAAGRTPPPVRDSQTSRTQPPPVSGPADSGDATVVESTPHAYAATPADRGTAAPPRTGGGLSRKTLLMIGAGVVVFLAAVFAVLQFAGSGLEEKRPGTGNGPLADAESEGPLIDPEGDEQSEVLEAEADEVDDLAPARPDTPGHGAGGTAVILPNVPKGPDPAEMREMQERIRKETADALRSSKEMLAKMRQTQEEQRTTVRQSAGPARQYLINSRPFALIYLDGGAAPINAEGKPAIKSLKPGFHTFRAVNADLVPPVDLTFKYEVKMGDPNNALILNLETRSVESRRNPTLPF
jgi:hypothetical protein